MHKCSEEFFALCSGIDLGSTYNRRRNIYWSTDRYSDAHSGAAAQRMPVIEFIRYVVDEESLEEQASTVQMELDYSNDLFD